MMESLGASYRLECGKDELNRFNESNTALKLKSLYNGLEGRWLVRPEEPLDHESLNTMQGRRPPCHYEPSTVVMWHGMRMRRFVYNWHGRRPVVYLQIKVRKV